ncbi:MAG: MBL fold metallo-hydrolase, partial [Clostridium sp.]|nr:MBL fold metallo-hydrolase [Clostridium sp.]
NIIRETEQTWPGKKIYALVGGLHLFRSSDEEVRALAVRVKDLGIEKIYTGHCTGARAMELLEEELGDVVEQIYTGMEIQI